MSSPEYLRRHYGITQPEVKTQRISTPENLARRTAAVSTSPDITPFKPAETKDLPDVSLTPSPTPAYSISWAKGAAVGNRNVEPQDYLDVPYENPDPIQIETPQTNAAKTQSPFTILGGGPK
jgi:hypothetical protein